MENKIKQEITFEELMKVDVRMCKITSVEKVENADKLYKLQIDTGVDSRVVVSAIADKFTPEQLVNATMPFVLNLTPRKIRGIESFGMILMAENPNGDYIHMNNNSAEPGAIIL